MGLEDILKETKKIVWDIPDKAILKYYTRKVKKAEENGSSAKELSQRYHLHACAGFIPAGIITCGNVIGSVFRSMLNNIFGVASWRDLAYIGKQLVNNTIIASLGTALLYNKDRSEEYRDEHADVMLSSEIEDFKNWSKHLRYPFFIGGIGLTLQGIYSFFDGVKAADAGSMISSINHISAGYMSFNLAASIYVKDNDPKLLQKNIVKERVLQPIPETV